MDKIDYTKRLNASSFKIRKYQKRVVSEVFSTNDETASQALGVYTALSKPSTRWTEIFDAKTGSMPKHDYKQSRRMSENCDAYAVLCDWAEEEAADLNRTRRIAEGMCCYSLQMPPELIDPTKNTNNADLNVLSFKVFSDKWLANGCYAAVFFSDNERPPEYDVLKEKIDSNTGEIEGDGFFAGCIGDCSVGGHGIKYLRTDVICKTSDLGPSANEREGIVQPLVFMLHDWEISNKDASGMYIHPQYIHIMLFLTEKQYTTDRAYWIEGGAAINVNAVTLSLTEEIIKPSYGTPVCQKLAFHTNGNFQGAFLSLVNHVKPNPIQSYGFLKQNSNLCDWSAIETSVHLTQKPNAIYSYGNFPSVGKTGFDFNVVDASGNEYIRVGCVDENANVLFENHAKPSVYSAIFGFPVNPGVNPVIYGSLCVEKNIEGFSECVGLRVVIYAGKLPEQDGANYSYPNRMDASVFRCATFFSGEATRFVFSNGDSVDISGVHAGNYSAIYAGEEMFFSAPVTYSQPGLLIVGICPVNFTKNGTMTEGWRDSAASGYDSEYMQLVEWPLNGMFSLRGYE